MLDRRWRAGVEQGLRPLASGLRRAGVTANHLTVLGLVASGVTALLVADGRLGWAVAALAASGIPDVLDGAVAKSSGTAGPRGAFFDSVADRVSDALVLGGVAWYYTGGPAARHPKMAVVALALLALTMLVSYERARAESLGFDARGGFMERAERMIVLGAGLTFDVLGPVLGVMLVLTALTAVQRFVMVWRQAPRPGSWGPGEVVPGHEHVRRPRLSERPRVQRLAQWWPSRRGAVRSGRARRAGSVLDRRRNRP